MSNKVTMRGEGLEDVNPEDNILEVLGIDEKQAEDFENKYKEFCDFLYGKGQEGEITLTSGGVVRKFRSLFKTDKEISMLVSQLALQNVITLTELREVEHHLMLKDLASLLGGINTQDGIAEA